MAPPQGTVRVAQQGRTIIFRVEGRATMALSLPFRRCGERCLAEGAASLRVDLRHGTYMDSTFLGDLLVLKRAVESHGQGDFALVSPSSSCRQLLQQMRLELVFPIVTAAEPDATSWEDLPGDAGDVNSFKLNVVQAHQELANLEGPAGEAFREVARCLTQALEAEKAR